MNPLSLIPTGWLWPVAGIAGLTLLATLGVQTLRLSMAQRDLAEVQAEAAADRQEAAEDAQRREAAARTEEQRRTAAQKGITDATLRQLAAARADAADADAVADRLRVHALALAAAAGGGARDPTAAGGGPTAADAADLLAELQRGAEERAGILARIADERGAAGEACERAYESLTRVE